MHITPSITARPAPVSPSLPLDQFQSRIEPFVTVERELWRLFILAYFASAPIPIPTKRVDLIVLSKSCTWLSSFGYSGNDFPWLWLIWSEDDSRS